MGGDSSSGPLAGWNAAGKTVFKLDKIGSDNVGGVGGSVTLKKTMSGVKTSITFSERTLKDVGSAKDVKLVASKDIGSGLVGALEYDAGARGTKTLLAWTNPAGDVKLGGTWLEAGNVFKGEAEVALDDANFVAATYDWSLRVATASYTHKAGGASVTTKYDFGKESWKVVAATKRGGDAYKAEFDVGSRAMLAEWSRKPYKLSAKGKLTDGGVKDLSVSLTTELTYQF